MVRKVNNEFYRYERSDGTDKRYEISKEYFLCYGVHENTLLKFDEIINSDAGYRLIGKGSNITTIKPTEYPNVYKLEMGKNEKTRAEYIAPRSALKDFNTIVNHTPNGKQSELFGWH